MKRRDAKTQSFRATTEQMERIANNSIDFSATPRLCGEKKEFVA
jgi:hypothetical protein